MDKTISPIFSVITNKIEIKNYTSLTTINSIFNTKYTVEDFIDPSFVSDKTNEILIIKHDANIQNNESCRIIYAYINSNSSGRCIKWDYTHSEKMAWENLKKCKNYRDNSPMHVVESLWGSSVLQPTYSYIEASVCYYKQSQNSVEISTYSSLEALNAAKGSEYKDYEFDDGIRIIDNYDDREQCKIIKNSVPTQLSYRYIIGYLYNNLYRYSTDYTNSPDEECKKVYFYSDDIEYDYYKMLFFDSSKIRYNEVST